MDGPRHHEVIAQLLIEIPPFSGDDTKIEAESRLRQTSDRCPPDRSPPSIKLVPEDPPKALSSRLQKLDRIRSGYRRCRIDTLPLKICRIIKAAGIQRSGGRPQLRPNTDTIALEQQSPRRTPGQPNHTRLTGHD